MARYSRSTASSGEIQFRLPGTFLPRPHQWLTIPLGPGRAFNYHEAGPPVVPQTRGTAPVEEQTVPTKQSPAPCRTAMSPSGARFLRPYQVEALYGLGQKYLAHARVRGDGPQFSKAGKLILYAVADIEDWLARRRRRSTSDPGAGEE